MLSYFKPDGMFFDMPYWPQLCFCDKCRARWEKEYGGKMPVDETDSRMRNLKDARMRWMSEFVEEVASHTRGLRPELSVKFNCAYGIRKKRN